MTTIEITDWCRDYPTDVICQFHNNMSKVTGAWITEDGDGRQLLHDVTLQCGHRAEPPFIPGAALYLADQLPPPAQVSLAWHQDVSIPLADLLAKLLLNRYPDFPAADWATATTDQLYMEVVRHFPLKGFTANQVEYILRDLHMSFVFHAGPKAIESA